MDIVNFIEKFMGYPLQLVLLLGIFAMFLYWFIKERPKAQQTQSQLIQSIMNECNANRSELLKERTDFFKIMDDYRVQNAQISALYDKALENSTRAIENNTEMIKNQNTHAQLTNQALANLSEAVERAEEKLEKIEDSQQTTSNKVNESIVILQNMKGGK